MTSNVNIIDLFKELDLRLASLKIHPDMSEETTAFSAVLVRGGKKIGRVSNDGKGGCNRDYPFSAETGPDLRRAVKDIEAKNLVISTKSALPGEDFVYPLRFDSYVDFLMEFEDARKQTMRGSGKSVIAEVAGPEGPEIRIFSFKRKVGEPEFEWVRQKRPGAKILNNATEAELLKTLFASGVMKAEDWVLKPASPIQTTTSHLAQEAKEERSQGSGMGV